MSCEDLEEFYNNMDFEIVDSFTNSSPSGTIKLKHVFPITTQARKDYDKDDEVDLVQLGGMGGQKTVYKGQLRSDNRFMALAFMNDVSDLDMVECFFAEARIAMSLNHPSIINTHNFGIDEEFGPYCVMDWVEGETLNHVLKNLRLGVTVYEESFTMQKLLAYYLDICKALSFAHSKDIIHLDIKPENILIDYEKDKVFLFDWGLAKAFSPLENFNIDPLLLNHDTKEGYFRGTPGYMPPEQITEQTKNMKTDIYQLGALLYTMIFKHCPVEGDNVEEILNKTLAGEIFVDSINKDHLPLIAICKRAMSPNPEERYPNVRSIINEVNEINLTKEKCRRRLWPIVLAALLPIALVVSAFFLVDEGRYELKRVEITEQFPSIRSNASTSASSLLTSDDIALLEEFSHYDAEEYDKPLYMIENPVPAWYNYLGNLMNREMGSLIIEDLDLLLKIESLISFYKMEDGL